MTNPDCEECEGTGYVEYLISVDDSRPMACEVCNDGGDEPDEDAEYERHRDNQVEAELEARNDRD